MPPPPPPNTSERTRVCVQSSTRARSRALKIFRHLYVLLARLSTKATIGIHNEPLNVVLHLFGIPPETDVEIHTQFRW